MPGVLVVSTGYAAAVPCDPAASRDGVAGAVADAVADADAVAVADAVAGANSSSIPSESSSSGWLGGGESGIRTNACGGCVEMGSFCK